MRNIIIMIATAVIGVLTLVIVMSISGREHRSMEIKSGFSSVVEETVEDMLESGEYSIDSTNEFLADLSEDLSQILDSDCELTVEVQQIDREKGLLSVKVTEKFKYPNGRTGSIEVEKTVLLSGQEESPEEQEEYAVSFYLSKEDMEAGEECYKEYAAYAGGTVPVPEDPQMDGSAFGGWKGAGDYLADFSQPVEQDMAYYAVWN